MLPSSLPDLQTKLNLGVVVCVLKDSVQTLISGRDCVAWVFQIRTLKGIGSIVIALGMVYTAFKLTIEPVAILCALVGVWFGVC